MKGIVLAAGKGTRLYPVTTHIPKPLLPIYDKPLIYYPISLLIGAGIKEILVIVPPEDMEPFVKLLGDGSKYGVSIIYKEQPVQRGIADAFIIGREFIGDDDVCLMLGDNIFFSGGIETAMRKGVANPNGAMVFGLYVKDPRPFGVVEFDSDGRAISIEEKPTNPKSNYIIPGIYFYDNKVIDIATSINPSARGELEITTVNEIYLENNQLKVEKLGTDINWFDAGTPDSMLNAASHIAKYQKENNTMIGCIEECSYNAGLINKEQLKNLGENLCQTPYGNYLLSL